MTLRHLTSHYARELWYDGLGHVIENAILSTLEVEIRYYVLVLSLLRQCDQIIEYAASILKLLALSGFLGVFWIDILFGLNRVNYERTALFVLIVSFNFGIFGPRRSSVTAKNLVLNFLLLYLLQILRWSFYRWLALNCIGSWLRVWKFLTRTDQIIFPSSWSVLLINYL